MRISVACVGTKKDELTLEVARAAREADRVILHTERCGFAEWLKENGVSYESLDALYETAEDFDEHAQLAAEAVMKAQGGHVLYAVLDEADNMTGAAWYLPEADTLTMFPALCPEDTGLGAGEQFIRACAAFGRERWGRHLPVAVDADGYADRDRAACLHAGFRPSAEAGRLVLAP